MLRVSRTYTHTYVLTVPMSQHHLIMHVHHLILSLSLSLSISFNRFLTRFFLLFLISIYSFSHFCSPSLLPSPCCSSLTSLPPLLFLSQNIWPISPSLTYSPLPPPPTLTHLAPPPSHLHNDGEPVPERLDPARWRKAPAESALPLTGRIHLQSLCMAKGER